MQPLFWTVHSPTLGNIAIEITLPLHSSCASHHFPTRFPSAFFPLSPPVPTTSIPRVSSIADCRVCFLAARGNPLSLSKCNLSSAGVNKSICSPTFVPWFFAQLVASDKIVFLALISGPFFGICGERKRWEGPTGLYNNLQTSGTFFHGF